MLHLPKVIERSNDMADTTDFENSLPSPAMLSEHARRSIPVTVRLSDLWTGLSSGSVSIIASYCDESHCYVAVQQSQRRRRRSCLSPRNLRMLERVLAGASQKAVALDMGLAPSTVAVTVSRCVHAMGLECRLASVPLLMIMALHAARNETHSPVANMCTLEHEGRSYRVIWATRPDANLLDLLSRGESAVARLMVEGKTYAEIAAMRHRSVRTIANQLAKTYDKLGVSGRVHLVHQLVSRRARARVALSGVLPTRIGTAPPPSSRRLDPVSPRLGGPPPSSRRSPSSAPSPASFVH